MHENIQYDTPCIKMHDAHIVLKMVCSMWQHYGFLNSSYDIFYVSKICMKCVTYCKEMFLMKNKQ